MRTPVTLLRIARASSRLRELLQIQLHDVREQLLHLLLILQLCRIHNVLRLQVAQEFPQILKYFLFPTRHRPIGLDKSLDMTQNHFFWVVFHIWQRLDCLDLDP